MALEREDMEWKIFEKTGKIEDYLRFSKTRREKKDAFKNCRDSSQAKKISQ